MADEAVLVGQNFQMGGVSVTSRYNRVLKSGFLNVDIDQDTSLAQRKSVAQLIREFAAEIERD